MTETLLEAWIIRRNLQEVSDADGQGPVHFRAHASALLSISEFEKRVCDSIRGERKKRGLSQRDLAVLLGIDVTTFANLEAALSPASIGMLIHVCEVLCITPTEILAPSASHLWGENATIANLRTALDGELCRFNAATLMDIYRLIAHLPTSDWKVEEGQ